MISSLKWKRLFVKFLITDELRKKLTYTGSANQWFTEQRKKAF